MADWQEQRRRAVDAHAAALERQRAAETARAHELVAAFARTARERGLRAVRLRARGYNGRSTYRTRVRGWYLRPDRSIAVGEDGGYYVLAVPGGLWAKLIGVVVAPQDPRLIVGEGGRDGESMPLESLLRQRLAADDAGP